MRRIFICAFILAAADSTVGAQVARAPVGDTAFRFVDRGVPQGHPLGDSTELALIAELKGLYSDSASQAYYEQALRSTAVTEMKSSNPKAQAILDRIFARRKAIADSVIAARPKRPDPPLILNATVVFVDSPSDPLASAEIRRRADMEPHEVILLPANRATLGAMGAAIQALSDLWVGDGLLPVPSSNVNFMVQDEKLMKSWTPLQQDMMMGQLTNAARLAKAPVAGIGDVRSFVIAVAHRRPAPSKP
jgi:hypothetical protein